MRTVQLAVRRVCDSESVKTPANLARLLSSASGSTVSPSMVQQWLDGRRPVPAPYCPALSRLGGCVPLWELRPRDWHLLWPAEIGKPGAPAVAVVPVLMNWAPGSPGAAVG